MSRHQAPVAESTLVRERDAYTAGPWVEDHHGRHNQEGKP